MLRLTSIWTYVKRLGTSLLAVALAGLLWLGSTGRSVAQGLVDTLKPVGGVGGVPFSDQGLVTPDQSVRQVIIHHGAYVDSIALGVGTAPKNLTDLQELPRHGGLGGQETRINLAPDEYITGVEGRYDYWLIHSVSIITNKATYGPFGGDGGDRAFQLQVPRGAEVIGFAGQSGGLLDALGLVYRDRPAQVLEPVGGVGGTPFSDRDVIRPSQSVAEMIIQQGRFIDAVGLVLLDDMGQRQELRHGGFGGEEIHIPLAEGEYITGLQGRYDYWLIHSLTVQTNQNVYGPYGGFGGDRQFSFDVPPNAEIIGFVGQSGGLLDAIGVVYRDRLTDEVSQEEFVPEETIAPEEEFTPEVVDEFIPTETIAPEEEFTPEVVEEFIPTETIVIEEESAPEVVDEFIPDESIVIEEEFTPEVVDEFIPTETIVIEEEFTPEVVEEFIPDESIVVEEELTPEVVDEFVPTETIAIEEEFTPEETIVIEEEFTPEVVDEFVSEETIVVEEEFTSEVVDEFIPDETIAPEEEFTPEVVDEVIPDETIVVEEEPTPVAPDTQNIFQKLFNWLSQLF